LSQVGVSETEKSRERHEHNPDIDHAFIAALAFAVVGLASALAQQTTGLSGSPNATEPIDVETVFR